MTKKFLYLKYLNIPNAMTGSSLAIGFITFILMLNHELKIALTLFALTIVLDRMDGIAARKFKMESAFGKELDSLTDFFNFCILPPIMAYVMGFNLILSVVLLIIYILSGVSRLAHFNLTGMDEIDGKQYFSGVPTTIAASWFLITVSLLQTKLKFDLHYLLSLFFVVFAILMVFPLKCGKNGWVVKSLYLLIPMAVIVLWIF
jgi:CDP-diacylglycerol---serine O-phosphatidyltransferase